MLEPIANVLQVSVVELLKGERIGSDATITMQEAQQIVNESISISEDKHIKKQNIHKKIIYMLCCIMIFLLSWLMNAPYFLYTAILVMIALPGISFAKKKTFVDEPHSYDVFKRLQGLFTIVILIHQLDERIWEFSEYGGELSWYRPFGVLLMGFFFFSFGYEVVISLQTEKNYLKTFLLHRIGMVLGTFFICNSAYIFITLLQGTRYTTDVLIKAFSGVLLLNDHMWFLVEILLLYTVFYIGFCFIKNNIVQYGWMLAVILFIMVISFLNGHDIAGKTISNWFEGEWWYNTILLFFVGMVVAQYCDKIILFLKKWYFIIFIIAISVFAICFHCMESILEKFGYWTETATTMGYYDKAITFAVQFPMILCFTIIVLLLMMKIKVKNKVLDFMGEISLGIIMMQNTIILIFEHMAWKQNVHVYCIGIIVATVISAIGINGIKRIVWETIDL